jgi:hypothetical protein
VRLQDIEKTLGALIDLANQNKMRSLDSSRLPASHTVEHLGARSHYWISELK